VWSHPDLLPGPDDLDDPLGFAERGKPAGGDEQSADFDAALSALLSEEAAAAESAEEAAAGEPQDAPPLGDAPTDESPPDEPGR
jgi:hypothetical protein